MPLKSLVVASDVVRQSGSGFRLEVRNLSIDPGEVVALIGENGAGKSTLARILAGIWQPDQGSVRWRSLDPHPTAAALARRVGYLQQSLPGAIGLTVEEVVELGRFVHRHEDTATTTATASRRALEMMGLGGFARRLIDRLSGGERKRALLAAVLAQQAPLLILDEPTAHLDPASHRRVAAAIRDYVAADRESRAALVASHDLHFARAVADRVLGLAAGKLVDLGTREEAFTVRRLAGLFATDFVTGAEGPPVVDLR